MFANLFDDSVVMSNWMGLFMVPKIYYAVIDGSILYVDICNFPFTVER